MSPTKKAAAKKASARKSAVTNGPAKPRNATSKPRSARTHRPPARQCHRRARTQGVNDRSTVTLCTNHHDFDQPEPAGVEIKGSEPARPPENRSQQHTSAGDNQAVDPTGDV